MNTNQMDGFNRDTIHNRPPDRGIIPGTRTTHRYQAGQNGSTLSDHTQMIFNIVGAGREGAYIGKSAKIVTRCTLKTAAGTNVVSGTAPALGIRNGGDGLLWESLNLGVNGGLVNAGQRTDVTRHVSNMFLTNVGDKNTYGVPGRIGNDNSLLTGVFTNSDVQDGKTFELVRMLDDLPLFGKNDGLIPSFLNLRIDGVIGTLSKVFAAPAADNAGTPIVTLVECFLAIDWVEVEKVVINDWNAAYLQRTLMFDTSRWYTHAENIASGVTQFQGSASIGLHNVPNFIICQLYNENDFTTGPIAFNVHPLAALWHNVNSFRLHDNAGDVAHYEHLDSNRVELFTELAKLGHQHSYVNFTADNSAVTCIPKVYRSDQDILTQPTQMVNYRISMVFKPATTVRTVLYVTSMVRQGYLVTVDGVQPINLQN